MAQQPPNPDYQRQQVFASYDEFKNRLTQISELSDAVQRQTELDALWSQLISAGQVPYVQGDRVAFLYRGGAASVAWPGDFNGWNPAADSWRGGRLANTDLWILEKTFSADARLDYKIVAGGAWIFDTANPLQMWSGFGPNSELRMPEYQYPRETIRRPGTPRGALSDNIRTQSASLGYSVNYRVYTPAGYSGERSQNLPVVYVTDGHEYAADHLGAMVIVLDNLIADRALQPTIAVLIDPRDPVNPSVNRRASEYVQNPKFAAFVADELAPSIDAAYRTLKSPRGRMILGTSLGGLNAAYFGATRPEVFGKVAVQSPASFSQFAPGLLNLYASGALRDDVQVYVTAGTIGDGNGGTSFAATLEQHGYDYAFKQTNEGHSWGQWRGLLDDMLVELIGAAPIAAADFNEDGAIDAADLARWRAGAAAQFGAAGAAHKDGDANGDRAVDGADFLLWQQQYAAAGQETAPIPEPPVAALLACGMLVLRLAARRRGGN